MKGSRKQNKDSEEEMVLEDKEEQKSWYLGLGIHKSSHQTPRRERTQSKASWEPGTGMR
jgi:hypothetical protein